MYLRSKINSSYIFLKQNILGLLVFLIVSFKHFFDHFPDVNWDRANYADYIVYSLLNNRWDLDWAVGGLNNFNSPIPSIPGYLFSLSNPAYGFVILIIFLIALYYFANQILQDLFSKARIFSGHINRAAATNIILGGPLFFSEIGTTMGDWPIILLTTSSLSYLIKFIKDPAAQSNLFRATFLISCSSFLKMSNGLFLISFLLTVLVFTYNSKNRITYLISVSKAIALSSFLNSFWLIKVWLLTGNPIFPYFNALFKSQYYPEENIRDRRWEISNFQEVFYPFSGFWGNWNLEFSAYDPRITLSVIIIGGIIVLFLFKIKSFDKKFFIEKLNELRVSPIGLLMFFSLCSYCFWALSFFYARYIMPLEITIGVVLIYLLNRILKSAGGLKTSLILVYILIISISVVPNWNMYQAPNAESLKKEGPFQGDSRWMIKNSILKEGNSTFLVVGMHLGYLVRSSNPSNQFVRLEFYGKPTLIPLMYKKAFQSERIFLLTNQDPTYTNNVELNTGLLLPYNLSVSNNQCSSHLTVSENYWICPLKRAE